MNSEPQLFSDPLPANIQAAIASTSASIATLEPVYGAGGKLDSFRLLYANPSFLQLACDSHEQLDFERTAFLPALLKLPNIRSRLNEVWRSNTSKLSTINYQKREKSFVLQLSVAPVEGLLVITLVDITSLSHTHEMLELQTTLMEENTRSLEAVRSALEAEIGRRGRLENKLRKLASTDHLSGLANRRAFMERAAAEYRRSLRYQHPLSIAMLDLDRFKTINDTHGHAAGDTVIVAISQICQSLSRDGVDVVGRIGGEEFAILLPETTLQGASNFAERLRLMIQNTPILCDITKVNITASLGVATLEKQDRDFSTLLKRADGALYISKETGRNMVTCD